MDRMETIFGENDGVIRRITNRIRKYNRTTPVQSGVFELKTTLDDSLIIISAPSPRGDCRFLLMNQFYHEDDPSQLSYEIRGPSPAKSEVPKKIVGLRFNTPFNGFYIFSVFGAYNWDAGQYKKIFGRTLGPFCQTVYEDHVKKEVQRFMESTNISVKYGECPIPAQYVDVYDFRMGGIGDYLPPYIPGNERWMVEVNLTKAGKVIGGSRQYAIVRDNQKLFDSKFG